MDIYLSGKTLAFRAGAEVLVQEIAEGEWQAPLQAWVADRRSRKWRVWLGGSQFSLHMVDPIAGVRSIEEAEAALSASFAANGQPLAARLAIWSAASTSPWIVAATPSSLVPELIALLGEGDGRLSSIRPWWAAQHRGSRANAAMCDGEAISYWRTDPKGKVVAAGTLRASGAGQIASLQRLRVGGPLPGQRLDLRVPDDSALPGFASIHLEEAADAATVAAV